MSVKMTVLQDRDSWLSKRSNYIGGSDAASIIGMNPYRNNVDLWEIKTGRVAQEDISDKPYVRYGTLAEEHLRALYALDYPQYKVLYVENNDLLKKMNIDKKELFEAAKANTTVNDVQIIDIIQAFAMSEMFGLDVGVESLSVMTLENMKLNSYTPYAISNKEGRYGAVYMMNYVLMEQISKELGGDFYILPPSIHGIIVIGIEDETDSEERHIDAIMHLKEMVIEVNKSEVPLEDVLTNTIYKYDSKKGEVVIA